ncbi:MAG: protein kinase, partial [Planctomycetaceae bacterium]|nr:protein kinase [Planctomycetaceae bacterium]
RDLDRQVALKVPKFSSAEDSDVIGRFYREARAAATLRNPNICPVYNVGEINGIHYLAMAYIHGRPLQDFINPEKPRPQRQVVSIVRKLTGALQEAHTLGIVHRDLKPANIMIDERQEPMIMDFGLARHLILNDADFSSQGDLIGSPAYMSPEQIEGNPQKIGPAADIYSLGVMLYELLTGQLPFRGSLRSIISQALNKQPERPSKIRSAVDPDLEDLCLSMLEKDASRRPASMQAIADTLENWLQHTAPEAVAQRQKSDANREKLEEMKAKILDLAQRGQFAAAVAGLEKMISVTVPGAADYVAWAKQKLPEIKAMPQQLRENAPTLVATAKKFMKIHDYAQAAELITQIPLDFRSEVAQRLLDEAIELQDESDLLLMDLKECVRKKQYDGIDGNLKRFLELKPGNRFAKELKETLKSYARVPGRQRSYKFDKKGNLLPYAEDHTWKVWLGLSALVGLVVFGVAYQYIMIYLRSENRTLAVQVDKDWLDQQGGQLSLLVDGDKHTISGPGLNVTVTLGEHDFSVQSGDTVVHNPQHFEIVKGDTRVLIVDASGVRLQAPAAGLGQVPSEPSDVEPVPPVIVDAPLTPLPDGEPGLVKTLEGHPGFLHQISFTPNGRQLVSMSGVVDGTIKVTDLESGDVKSEMVVHNTYAFAIHPNGKQFAMGSFSTKQSGLFDLDTCVKKVSFQWGSPALSIDYSRDGQFLAMYHRGERGILVYHLTDDATTPNATTLPGSKTGSQAGVAFLPNNLHLLASSSDSTYGTRLFDVETGRELASFGPQSCTSSNWLAVHPSGKDFVTTQGLSHFSISQSKFVRSLGSGDERPVFSPDGRHLISVNPQNAMIIVRSFPQGNIVWQTKTSSADLYQIAISPDGRFVAVGGSKPPIGIWRLPKEVWPQLSTAASSASASPAEPPAPMNTPSVSASTANPQPTVPATSPSRAASPPPPVQEKPDFVMGGRGIKIVDHHLKDEPFVVTCKNNEPYGAAMSFPLLSGAKKSHATVFLCKATSTSLPGFWHRAAGQKGDIHVYIDSRRRLNIVETQRKDFTEKAKEVQRYLSDPLPPGPFNELGVILGRRRIEVFVDRKPVGEPYTPTQDLWTDETGFLTVGPGKSAFFDFVTARVVSSEE